ncbi:MAG TPA: DUF4252 domain-containing protein [Bacteroidales bacterium]|nr:DUF4252 domain-containing protein [Bacteroidales bacterium]
MKKIGLIALVALLFAQSCITDKDKYKETDIFEAFETQQGFVVLHLPPVLFKFMLNLSEDKTQSNSDLIDKIEVIKVLFFEETKTTISSNEVKDVMSKNIKGFKYNLLTNISQEQTDVSIYIIEQESTIREVLVTLLSEKEYIALNVVGEFSKEEVLKIYQSINMQQVKSMGN